MKVNFYIDGYNLYFGCIANSRHKWLDLGRFCTLSLPKHEIGTIYYFTARVKNDLDKAQRQHTYLQALEMRSESWL